MNTSTVISDNIRRFALAVDIEGLYTKYGPMVLRRCRHLLKNEELALDAMQDVFVKILKSLDRLTVDYPSSLLYTITTNHCLNIIRKEQRVCPDNAVLEQIISTDMVEDKAINRLFLDQLFQNQKASTRTIAILHYMDGLTLEETAEMSGLSISGVRRRLRKLREAGLKLEGREV